MILESSNFSEFAIDVKCQQCREPGMLWEKIFTVENFPAIAALRGPFVATVFRDKLLNEYNNLQSSRGKTICFGMNAAMSACSNGSEYGKRRKFYR